MHGIGELRTEQLDIAPAQLRVRVTRRPRYACRSCEEAVVVAPAPARPIVFSDTQNLCSATISDASIGGISFL
jgi:transposase